MHVDEPRCEQAARQYDVGVGRHRRTAAYLGDDVVDDAHRAVADESTVDERTGGVEEHPPMLTLREVICKDNVHIREGVALSLTCSGPPDVAGLAAARVACVEVGASGCQSTVVDGETFRRFDGVDVPSGRPLLLAVPGLIDGPRVLAASNLGWYDVDPVEKLGLQGSAALLLGDAEAAVLGEYALRGADTDLLYVGLGTGVGGAVVRDGRVVDNLLGHLPGFGDRPCRCSQVGCLETIAGGWALPRRLSDADVRRIAVAVAQAVRAEPLAQVGLVVVAGGIAARHPEIVSAIAEQLSDRTVEPTAAPADAKSASAWGLLYAFRRAS
jgi:hypothetical protein